MADWQLNYADREVLREKLVPRCAAAVRKFLLYVHGGGGSPSPERLTWVKANLKANVNQLAVETSQFVMSEPGFLEGGTSITDAAIQSRVESVLVSDFMPA